MRLFGFIFFPQLYALVIQSRRRGLLLHALFFLRATLCVLGLSTLHAGQPAPMFYGLCYVQMLWVYRVISGPGGAPLHSAGAEIPGTVSPRFPPLSVSS